MCASAPRRLPRGSSCTVAVRAPPFIEARPSHEAVLGPRVHQDGLVRPALQIPTPQDSLKMQRLLRQGAKSSASGRAQPLPPSCRTHKRGSQRGIPTRTSLGAPQTRAKQLGPQTCLPPAAERPQWRLRVTGWAPNWPGLCAARARQIHRLSKGIPKPREIRAPALKGLHWPIQRQWLQEP